ncbi:MAG: type II toxin-antitoxin system RelE/ParE family toxin [Candidatus Acidiferrales bacterium]
MTREGSKSRIRWEGNSLDEIQSWPKPVKENIGGDLERLERHEEPLDSRAMGKSLPGVRELRDEHKHVWYRLFYWLHAGWIYVLHCFTKQTNQSSLGDINLAKQRMKAIKQRNDAPAESEKKRA